MKVIFLAVVFLISLYSTAKASTPEIRAGAGLYSQSSPKSTLPPFIYLDGVLPLGGSYSFIPEFGFIWFEEISNSKRYHIFLNPEFGYQINEALRIKAGPGILFRFHTGGGGTIRDSNSSGRPFVNPGKTHTGQVFTLNAGIEAKILRKYVMRVESYIVQLMDSQHRQFNLAFSLGIIF